MSTRKVTRNVRFSLRCVALPALALVALWAGVAAALPAATAPSARMIIVALADKPDPVPNAGSTPRGYGGLPNYNGSARALSAAARLAHEYDLREVSAWTIAPLRLRCMLYEIATGAVRDDTLKRLHADPRVRLAQPLQNFETLSESVPNAAVVARSADVVAYNDPYVGLQRGFSAIGADQAQRWANGSGVRIALIDTGVDAKHPDLDGRIAEQRDFIADPGDVPDADRHGTEVAGVIAATANNHLGIVGVAPKARLFSYRACWPLQANADAARCDSFTLAQAIGAAIAAGAQIINLSLGGPRDPLLEQLTGYALEHGAIVVGAVPPNGRLDGFPTGVPGVIAVVSSGDAHPKSVLSAPGRDILTLEPGGHYDYASGSSLATAHVSGAIALLLQVRPRLDGQQAAALLDRGDRGPDAPIDVCEAMLALGRSGAGCKALSSSTGTAHAPQ